MADREVVLCGHLNRMSRPPAIKNFFVFVSWVGDGKDWYLLMVSLSLIYGEKGWATFWNMFVIGVINLALYKTIKSLTDRARPGGLQGNLARRGAARPIQLPFRHTMHAVAFSLIACAHHPELSVLLMPASALIALSRVILGLHYPTDVIAGGLIGRYVASWFVPA